MGNDEQKNERTNESGRTNGKTEKEQMFKRTSKRKDERVIPSPDDSVEPPWIQNDLYFTDYLYITNVCDNVS